MSDAAGEVAIPFAQPPKPVEPVAGAMDTPITPVRRDGVFGFSSSAASAGDRVSDSSSEMIVEAAMVTANWR